MKCSSKCNMNRPLNNVRGLYLSHILQRLWCDGEINWSQLHFGFLWLQSVTADKERHRTVSSFVFVDWVPGTGWPTSTTNLTMDHEFTGLAQVFCQQRALHVTAESVLGTEKGGVTDVQERAWHISLYQLKLAEMAKILCHEALA